MKCQKLTPTAILPQYKRDKDAALDMYADQSIVILPQQRAIVSTGIACAIPTNHVGLIWDRSGLAANEGLHTMAGVIDETYRGEIGIVLINLSDKAYHVQQGDRIAQMIIQPVHHVTIEEVEKLDETVRGVDGFGSSGK